MVDGSKSIHHSIGMLGEYLLGQTWDRHSMDSLYMDSLHFVHSPDELDFLHTALGILFCAQVLPKNRGSSVVR